MSEDNEKQIIGLLTELVKWNKFLAVSALKDVVVKTLRSDTEKIVFEYSTGKLSSTEIGKIANVSHMTVFNYWKKWAALGILVAAETYQGRYKHICSLSELGLEVPETVKVETKQGEVNGSTRGTTETIN